MYKRSANPMKMLLFHSITSRNWIHKFYESVSNVIDLRRRFKLVAIVLSHTLPLIYNPVTFCASSMPSNKWIWIRNFVYISNKNDMSNVETARLLNDRQFSMIEQRANAFIAKKILISQAFFQFTACIRSLYSDCAICCKQNEYK